MSFAEFGGNNATANRRRVTQQQQQQQTTTQQNQQQPSTGSPSFNRGNPNLGLDSISESLLQYQRNVDILGKIVRSILSSHVYTPNNNELCIQYDAQVDVITQLEQRVQNQLNQIVAVQQQSQQSNQQSSSSNNPQTITIVTKLRRDFERVQAQAKSFQESAIYKIKSIRSTAAAGTTVGSNQQLNNNNNFTPVMSDEMIHIKQQQLQQLQQIQIQEDTLAIEIMKEREEEIRNINRGMVQVNEIYKDLANIVGQQQEQIDHIENSMDDAKNNANAGLKQIEKANEKYGSNTQCTIM